jgi:uncharacterized LabA/DUF88 family protein
MTSFRRLIPFVAYLLLVGCAANIPEKLGVSDLEWESYSHSKQKNLLANYEQMKKARENVIEESKDKQNLSGVFLEVSIYVNWQNYQPVRFNIFKEKCRNIEIRQAPNNDLKTELGVCFCDGILYLDSSRYDLAKKMGTANIYYSPLWLSGFVYKEINSSGYTKLNNVTIEVKQKELLSSAKNIERP